MTASPPAWLLLITNLPGHNPTLRMRTWRALKAGGAGLLRDGAYLLPNSDRSRALFEVQGAEIREAGGVAHVVAFETGSDAQRTELEALFDRTGDYREAIGKLEAFKRELGKLTERRYRPLGSI